MITRAWIAVVFACMCGALAACGDKRGAPASAVAPAVEEAPAEVGTLAWAIESKRRFERERDKYQHPAETLAFFELEPNMTVVEALPGRGWYTAILAPYLAKNGGVLYAASYDPITATDEQLSTMAEFKSRFLKDPDSFGDIKLTVLSAKSQSICPPGAADLVLAVNTTNSFMADGYAEAAFKSFYTALRPGGVLGIVQHRGRSNGLQDPQAGDGYVQEEYVKMLAREAGFKFVGASEVNANPKDTKDYPFGVWTLPPVLLTAPLGAERNDRFDSAKYIAIGESDRMTLKFRKPLDEPTPVSAPKPQGKLKLHGRTR